MNALAFIILAALAGLGVGAALTGFFLKSKHAKQEEETKDRIKSMLREAELTAETILTISLLTCEAMPANVVFSMLNN